MVDVGGNSRCLLSDDSSDEEKCPYHPLTQQYPGDSVEKKSCNGGSYLPHLEQPEKFSDDIDAISSCLGQEPFTAHESDDGEDDFMETDDDLLNWEQIQRIPWHLLDDQDWRDVYRVVVDTDKYVEDECRHMLRQIDCETRFICCSIEIPRSFFAWLKPGEAEQLRGVKGIVATHLRRKEFRPC